MRSPATAVPASTSSTWTGATDAMQVIVGRIGRAHGVRGEVSVDVRTDEPERRFAVGSRLVVTDTGATLTVRATRPHQGRLLICFDEVGDRPAADSVRGAVLGAEVSADDEPADPEEFYDHQLTGLEVRTSAGEQVGVVAEVLHLPGQDTLAIHRPDGGEVLVPFVSALVPAIELDDGYLVIDDVPGLLDPDAADVAR